MIRKCLYCGEEFEAKVRQAKFCCEKCHDRWHWDNKPLIKKKCKNCGKDFETKNNKTLFCSLKCSSNYNVNKVQQTCIKKYGTKAPLQLKNFLDKKDETCLKRYGVKTVMELDKFKRKQQETCLKRYGTTSFLFTDECPKHNIISKQNKKRAEFIHNTTGLDVEFEFRGIEGYSYDLKVGNFLIEIDPIVTHNSTKKFVPGIKEQKGIDKYYHQKKSLAAEKAGYHCIHLFDWDDNEQVKNWLIGLLTKRKNLHNGKIMKVDGKEAEKFYDANHLQGKCSATVHYGIYVKGELINCMSFTCFKGEWILVRFASKMGFRIYQGAGRLFRTFIREYNPDYVVSFSDITKHSGGLYNALGFVLDRINEPSYWWVDKTGTHIYWRRDCQKQNMHKLEGFDPNYKYLEHKDDPFWQQTESEIMESKGYLRIFDAGMRKHVWYKKKD